MAHKRRLPPCFCRKGKAKEDKVVIPEKNNYNNIVAVKTKNSGCGQEMMLQNFRL